MRFSEEAGGKKPMTKRSCLRAIRAAQKLCEGTARGQRETTLRLDEVIGEFRTAIYDWREKILAGDLPEEFSALPAPIVCAVALQSIDEAWAAFLREADDARQRCGVVSLVGRDYRREYIKEVADMFERMIEGTKEMMAKRLENVKGGTHYVEPV